MSLEIGDYVFFDDAIARVDAYGVDTSWYTGKAIYDLDSGKLLNWNIEPSAPYFTLASIGKAFFFKTYKDNFKFSRIQKEFLKEAIYWCLKREGLT